MTTNQALSGAGFDAYPPGVMDDNVLPYIAGEEGKIESEIYKIMHLQKPPEYTGNIPTRVIEQGLRMRRGEVWDNIKAGRLARGRFLDMDLGVEPGYFEITAHVNRVPVPDGHMEYVFVHTRDAVTMARVQSHLRRFNPLKKYKLPTSPNQPIMLVDDMLREGGGQDFDFPFDPEMQYTHPQCRPQPRLDVYNGRGMSVTLGQFRQRGDTYIYYTTLSHNTVRGAAGASILNAELLYTLLERGKLEHLI